MKYTIYSYAITPETDLRARCNVIQNATDVVLNEATSEDAYQFVYERIQDEDEYNETYEGSNKIVIITGADFKRQHEKVQAWLAGE